MHKYAHPTKFATIARPLIGLSLIGALACIIPGLYMALITSPPDYQQSENVRIMYIHVPAAWTAMFCYSTMGIAALIYLIWKHTLAGLYIQAASPIGAALTAICLITGSLWGIKSWGTWWVWDARLTSVLILFFIYMGIIVIARSFDNPEQGQKAASWMTLIGAVNLPIIKFSVEWWNTLHQPPSISSFEKIQNPSMAPDMLWPLLLMAAGFSCLFGLLALLRLENEILSRKIHNLRQRKVHQKSSHRQKEAA
ncbi:MAG: heme ABC transporter permease [Alphaproteobacteria bacterium]|nr:heme ABC transporter permease [Alphaproteobacteria bacterium]